MFHTLGRVFRVMLSGCAEHDFGFVQRIWHSPHEGMDKLMFGVYRPSIGANRVCKREFSQGQLRQVSVLGQFFYTAVADVVKTFDGVDDLFESGIDRLVFNNGGTVTGRFPSRKKTVKDVPKSAAKNANMSEADIACDTDVRPGEALRDMGMSEVEARVAASLSAAQEPTTSEIDLTAENVVGFEETKRIGNVEITKRVYLDNWAHRSKDLLCGTCMWYCAKVLEDTEKSGVGRCRNHAPMLSGWPVVCETDWCGDHKLDETKLVVEQ